MNELMVENDFARLGPLTQLSGQNTPKMTEMLEGQLSWQQYGVHQTSTRPMVLFVGRPVMASDALDSLSELAKQGVMLRAFLESKYPGETLGLPEGAMYTGEHVGLSQAAVQRLLNERVSSGILPLMTAGLRMGNTQPFVLPPSFSPVSDSVAQSGGNPEEETLPVSHLSEVPGETAVEVSDPPEADTKPENRPESNIPTLGLHWINRFLLLTSITAGFGIAIIYWGSSLNNSTLIFAGLITFSGAVISWFVPFSVISFWFLKGLWSTVRVNWPSIRGWFARS